MNQLLDRLRNDFQNEDARYAYADTVVNAFISAQIKTLREDQDLSQEDLAVLIGTKQSGVSRLERADYSAWKVETLRKLARAFGVRLKISFEEFGSLVPELGGLKKGKLRRRRFEDDPVFKEHVPKQEKEEAHAEAGALSTASQAVPPDNAAEFPGPIPRITAKSENSSAAGRISSPLHLDDPPRIVLIDHKNGTPKRRPRRRNLRRA